MTFSIVNFSNENNKVFKRRINFYSRNILLIKSFDSSKVIFESPLGQWRQFANKPLVFILNKVKLGVGLYFSCALYLWDAWGMAEKNTQYDEQNSDFHL
jgi:hypothetical protein